MVDGGEVEIALGYACGDGVGTGVADCRGEILQRRRLETGLGGIVRDEFGAIPRDGGLAFSVERRCNYEEAAVLIMAAFRAWR